MPFNPYIQHAIVTDPEKAEHYLPIALLYVDFQLTQAVVLPVFNISKLNPFNRSLRPAALFPLCLIFGITPADPEFSIRWLARLAGVGFTPTGLNDLARPHAQVLAIHNQQHAQAHHALEPLQSRALLGGIAQLQPSMAVEDYRWWITKRIEIQVPQPGSAQLPAS